MTPRHSPARLLLRALAVLGGAGVLMILGSTMAGAAETPPAPAGGVHVALPLPLPAPAPAPVAIAVPLPPALAPVLAPVVPTGTSVAVHTPVVSADLGRGGIAVTVDPPAGVPTTGLPTLPIPPLGGIDRPAPALETAQGGSTTAPVPPVATRRAPGPVRHAPTAIPAIVAAPDGPGTAPAPSPRPHDVPMQLAFELAGIAAGVELSARRRGTGEPTPVFAFLPALRDLIRLGAIPRGLPPSAPPGHGLLLARPG